MRVLAGTTTVSSAGTAVAISTGATAALNAVKLRIKAASLNLGMVFIGDSTVGNSGATAGWTLFAGQDDIDIPIPARGSVSLGNIYVNALTNGDAVRWIAVLT